jgi:hypothetical protein
MALNQSLLQRPALQKPLPLSRCCRRTRPRLPAARFAADDERSSRGNINLSAGSLLLASVCASLGAASGALGMELSGGLPQHAAAQAQQQSV